MYKWKTIAFTLWLIGLGLTIVTCGQLGLTASSTLMVMLTVGFFSFIIFAGLAITLVALDGMAEPHKQMAEFVDKKPLPDIYEEAGINGPS